MQTPARDGRLVRAFCVHPARLATLQSELHYSLFERLSAMKNFAILILLFVLGVVATAMYLRSSQKTPAAPADTSEKPELHGAQAEGIKGGPTCAKHHIPESIDAFCHPELVESLGFCRGLDVAEAFCTRCSPMLIAAFKAENDWCAEHSLPESQCKLCGAAAEPSDGT
jgi:hypothetical protein